MTTPGPGHLQDPGDFLFLHVDRYVSQFQQVNESLDVLTEYFPTDVVGVIVGCQRPHQVQARTLGPVDQGDDVVGGVDEQHVAGVAVADDIDVVAHRRSELVADGEVVPGQ